MYLIKYATNMNKDNHKEASKACQILEIKARTTQQLERVLVHMLTQFSHCSAAASVNIAWTIEMTHIAPWLFSDMGSNFSDTIGFTGLQGCINCLMLLKM